MTQALLSLYRQADEAARLMVISADCNQPYVPRFACLLTKTFDALHTHEGEMSSEELEMTRRAETSLCQVRRSPLMKSNVVELYEQIHGFLVNRG